MWRDRCVERVQFKLTKPDAYLEKRKVLKHKLLLHRKEKQFLWGGAVEKRNKGWQGLTVEITTVSYDKTDKATLGLHARVDVSTSGHYSWTSHSRRLHYLSTVAQRCVSVVQGRCLSSSPSTRFIRTSWWSTKLESHRARRSDSGSSTCVWTRLNTQSACVCSA